MTLTNKEKMISVISNGIAVFSLLQERDELPKNTTMYDFVLKVIPEALFACALMLVLVAMI